MIQQHRSPTYGKITRVPEHENERSSLSAHDAVSLYTTFVGGGIRCWVMGGWGVDALLCVETRPHHDLALLVSVADLEEFLALLTRLGFSEKLVWGESRWVDDGGVQRPTAFVQVDGTGRELDVHVIELMDDDVPVPLCEVPWRFDGHSLAAVGVIAGTEVRCVSAATQMQMHTGYELPPEHQQDADRLAQFLEGVAGSST